MAEGTFHSLLRGSMARRQAAKNCEVPCGCKGVGVCLGGGGVARLRGQRQLHAKRPVCAAWARACCGDRRCDGNCVATAASRGRRRESHVRRELRVATSSASRQSCRDEGVAKPAVRNPPRRIHVARSTSRMPHRGTQVACSLGIRV